MKNQTLDFYYDFGSPNAYFAWRALQRVSARTGLIVKMHPVLIGGVFKLTDNKPPWMAFGNVPSKMDYMRLEIQRFIKEHELVDFKFNSAFPVNTLLSMRVAMAALKAGVHDRYYPIVFKAMWEENQDISVPEVLQSILDTAGLNGKDLLVSAESDPVKEDLKSATQACVDRGVFGLPMMFLEDDMYFGKDRVWQVERAVVRAQAI